ncbi:MAG: hypothetical protein ACPHQ9_13720, partial [Marinobacter sp.]
MGISRWLAPLCLKRLSLTVLMALSFLVASPAHSQAESPAAADPGQALLADLADANPRQIDAAIEAIVDSGDPRARSWLDA